MTNKGIFFNKFYDIFLPGQKKPEGSIKDDINAFRTKSVIKKELDQSKKQQVEVTKRDGTKEILEI